MTNPQKFTKDVVIGLEIHVSLNTHTKLFCSCRNSHLSEPNENICPICLGHPGSRPLLNGKAVEYAVMLAKALDFEITDKLIFSRKTYFYPDLSKNYQITQYEEPLGKDGHIILDMPVDGKLVEKKIGLERIHIEEDPGAIIHKPEYTLIDYNRSGCPLCEIVTKPELNSPEEARAFIKKILTVVNYLSIFDYSNGIIKADLNISVKETGYKRTEIKGVSGFKDIQDALEYEIARQRQFPKDVLIETRGYDSTNKMTFSQRAKETEEDYGYIYESDIVPRVLKKDFLESIFSKIPVLPDERIRKYVSNGIDKTDAESLSSLKELSDLFDWLISKKCDSKTALRYLTREVLTIINDGLLLPSSLAEDSLRENIFTVISLFSERKINNHTAREMVFKIAKSVSEKKDFDVLRHLKNNNLLIDDSIDIESVCSEVIGESKQAVDDYLSGKDWSVNFLVGQVMKKTKGKAMPDEVKQMLKEKLDKKKKEK
ncbi:MAG: Asp-tRNA(Asn)/Glu-tRNA(Gln) amidotransferase subunit GatB [Nanoarchaeota archaeon]